MSFLRYRLTRYQGVGAVYKVTWTTSPQTLFPRRVPFLPKIWCAGLISYIIIAINLPSLRRFWNILLATFVEKGVIYYATDHFAAGSPSVIQNMI